MTSGREGTSRRDAGAGRAVAREYERAGALVVVLSGDLDAVTEVDVAAALLAALDGAEDRTVVVDLSEVGFLGSAGLRTLLMAHHAHPGLRFVSPDRITRRPIEVTGLAEVLRLHHSVDEAL